MKPRSIGSLVLLALLGCSGSGSSDHSPPFFYRPRWANQQRVPTASHLRGVRFNTPLQGFVVGESSSIYRTDDGGVTWIQEEHLPAVRGGDIAGIDFLGTELHVVGSANDNGMGRRWVSTDATNWTTADADGAGAKFVAVDVTPSTTGGTPFLGWALREDWNIHITSGSSTGEQTTLSALAATPATGAVAIDLLGTGPGYVAGAGGLLFETTDWTGTWTQVTTPNTETLRDVQILDAQTLFVCGNNGTLLWTETGSAALTGLPGAPAGVDLIGLHFFHQFQDESIGWVVGENGAVYRVAGTYTAGNWNWVWTLLTNTSTDQLWDVHVVPVAGTTPLQYAVYAAGDNGMVVKVVDDGTATAVTVLTGGFLDAINAVSFDPSGTRGVAVGDNGRVYKTLNGGALWTSLKFGTTKWTGACVPSGNSNVAYICGEGGALKRNLNLAADTWDDATGQGAANFRAILFPSSADVGVVVGDGATLLCTTNGTLAFSWAAPVSNTSGGTNYKSLATSFQGGGFGIYAGAGNGVIAESTIGNLTATWTAMAVPAGFATNPVAAIAAPTPDIFFAAVDDAGARFHRRLVGFWQTASQPVAPLAAGIAFAGQSRGWLVCDRIYMTENGANNLIDDWTVSPVHTTSTFNGIWMSPSGTVGYVVGTNGAILKTTSGGKP